MTGRLPVVVTEHELVLLERAHLEGLAGPAEGTGPAPHHPDRWEDDGGALTQARSSLTARGLLTADGQLDDSTPAGLLLCTVLDVVLGAEVVVITEFRLADEAVTRVLHLLPFGGVLQDVGPDGTHGFDLLLERQGLVRAAVEGLLPPGVRPGAGAPRPVDLTRPAALPELLGHPTVLAELTLVRQGSVQVSHLLALGPGGSFAADRAGAGDPILPLFHPVRPSWGPDLVAAWVSEAVSEVSGPGAGSSAGGASDPGPASGPGCRSDADGSARCGPW